MQYRIVNYSPHVVREISRTYSPRITETLCHLTDKSPFPLPLFYSLVIRVWLLQFFSLHRLLLLLGHFSHVQLCATPQTAAHQAPPSLGFSRQEHWSGLPFPSPMRESEVTQSCPTLCNPMDCSLPGSTVHGIFQARVLEWGAIAFTARETLPKFEYKQLTHFSNMLLKIFLFLQIWPKKLNTCQENKQMYISLCFSFVTHKMHSFFLNVDFTSLGKKMYVLQMKNKLVLDS